MANSMKQLSQGKINDDVYVAGNHMYPGYVIKGKDKNLMIDAGMNLMGPFM